MATPKPLAKRKTVSREQRFHRKKAAETAERARQNKSSKGLASIASQSKSRAAASSLKGKERAKDAALQDDEDAHPFRYRSFNDRLASVHITLAHSLGRGGTGAIAGLDGHGTNGAGPSSIALSNMDLDDDNDDNDDDSGSDSDEEVDEAAAVQPKQKKYRANKSSLHARTSFGIALQTWRELNLSLPFMSLLQRIQPMSQSLPMILHNQHQLTTLLCETLEARHSDSYLGYEPVLDLIPRLAADLGPAFLSSYDRLLSAVLRTSTISKLNTESDEHVAALIVERSFESLAATLRCMAPYILREAPSEEGVAENWLLATWTIVKPYLGWIPTHSRSIDDSDGTGNPQAHTASRRSIPSHARRFASEALAHLVRRAKGDQLQEIANAMLRDVADLWQSVLNNANQAQNLLNFAAGAAGVWAEAIKSVDGRFQSDFAGLLDALISASERSTSDAMSQACSLIGNLVITASVHHGSAVSLVPLFNWLEILFSKRLEAVTATEKSADLEQMKIATSWMTTFLGTRKGKRVDDSIKQPLFGALLRAVTKLPKTSVASQNGLENSFVELIAVCFPIGRIQDLIGSGVRLIEQLASQCGEDGISGLYFKAVLSLSSLEWSGFKTFILPSVLDVTSKALQAADKSRQLTLDLLCRLDRSGHLRLSTSQKTTAASMRWRNALSTVIQNLLTDFLRNGTHSGEKENTDLLMALQLAPHLCAWSLSMRDLLCKAISCIVAMGHDKSKQSYDASPQNVMEIFALSLEAMATLSTENSASSPDVIGRLLAATTLADLLSFSAWHRHSVISLSKLMSAMSDKNFDSLLKSPQDALDQLRWAVMSTDETLRESAARILAIIEAQEPLCTSFRPMARIVEIENLKLAVNTLRERNVRSRAVVRDLLALKEQTSTNSQEVHQELDHAASVLVDYLTSTYKLNFSPLWSESRNALVDLCAKYGQLVWESAFGELQGAVALAGSPSLWSSSANKASAASGMIQVLVGLQDGLERQFQDPQFSQRRQQIASLVSEESQTILRRELASVQVISGRLDIVNYQAQILALFNKAPSIAERNNASLMRQFFTVIVEQNEEDDNDRMEETESSYEDETNAQVTEDKRHEALSPVLGALSKQERRDQLCAYLETFAHFSNPKALYRAEDLRAYLDHLLARGDGRVQRLALDVILQWKDPAHTTYADILKNLLKPSQFREQLTALKLAKGTECSIQPAHRSSFLGLIERLFFGLMTSKQSRAQGQANRKVSILTSLADLEADELYELVKIMIEPFATESKAGTVQETFAFTPIECAVSTRKQAGFLALLHDVIKHIGLQIIVYWPPLISTVLNISWHASVRAESGHGSATVVERSLRQEGLKRLNEFFSRPTDAFDWEPYLPALFSGLLSPRLPQLRNESVQSPSSVLELIHTWSRSPRTIHLLAKYDANLLDHVYACLKAPSIKPAVIARILDIMESCMACAGQTDDEVLSKSANDYFVQPNATKMLEALESLTQHCNSLAGPAARAMGKDELVKRLLHILAQLSSYLHRPSDVALLLHLLSPMLTRSNAIVPERNKVDVLQALAELLPKWLASGAAIDMVQKQHDIFSSLFSRLRTRSARDLLCSGHAALARSCDVSDAVIDNVERLNAFDRKRMGEYDFDKRLSAFDVISSAEDLSVQEWLPLLHNLVYFLQEQDEMAIRSSASAALRHFVEVVRKEHDLSGDLSSSFDRLFTEVVYTGIRRSLRSSAQLVQREAVELLGYAAQKLSWLPFFAEMQGLLVEGDEEASFFNNIHHIQLHRRLRALLRLGQEAQKAQLSTRTISDTFLPIVEQLLHTDSNHGDGNLIGHAVECLGQLSSQLRWGPYNVLLWKYLSLARSDDEDRKISTKVSVRASMSILDNFCFSMDDEVREGDIKDDVVGQAENGEHFDEGLSKSDNTLEEIDLEQIRKVLDAVLHRLLPKLMDFLDLKDELEDAVRIPIAIGIARVLLRLPQRHRRIATSRLLSVLANVFKSKSQDTRNLARTTLANVATTLGPEYFPSVVKELRKVLTRGPQVSVLAFSMHNVLLHCIEPPSGKQALTKLAHGTRDVVDIVIEDVFGNTAQDRQSIENRTTYREVKSSKSLDTIEHVARIVDPAHIATMLQPLRNLMSQTEAMQAVKGFDDCLRRIAVGLQANTNIDNNDYLVLCHTLLTNSSSVLMSQARSKGKGAKKASAVLRKRLDVEQDDTTDHFLHNAHRFVSFGLDMLHSAVRRGRFDVTDATQVAKLESLVPVVGNCLFAHQAGVVVVALRSLALLVKLPLKSSEGALPVLTKQALKLIESEGDSQSEIALGSVKLLAVIIRDRRDIEARPSDAQLSALCRYINGNLEENNDIQGTLFNLLRALVARKYIVSEIYDVMDKVASMLVVHQSENVRSTSRATYLDFLLDLPQGQKRFTNQMQFLAKNIAYTFESGRLSILDFIRMLYEKASEEVLRPYTDLFFVALAMCLVNDDSSLCRQRAANLLQQLTRTCRPNEFSKLLQLTQSWAQADAMESRNLPRLAMMLYGILIDAQGPQPAADRTWLRRAFSQARDIVRGCARELSEKEVEHDNFSDQDYEELDWNLPYQSLQVLARLHKIRALVWSNADGDDLSAERSFASVWLDIRVLVLFPHSWVRLSASRLIGEQMSALPIATPRRLPSSSSDSVEHNSLEDLVDLAKKMALAMRSSNLDEALALQIVKNLVHIGKCFALIDVGKRVPAADAEKDGEIAESAPRNEPSRLDDEARSDEGSEEEDDGDDDHVEELWKIEPLRWLFIRLSHQARKCVSQGPLTSSAATCASTILKWMAAIISHLETEQKPRYVAYVVAPLFRILEGGPSDASAVRYGKTPDQSDAAKRRAALEQLATEVQDLVQKNIGTSAYATAYANTKRRASDRRRARRAAEIQRTMDFPEAALARKAVRNQRKHESRKRKHQAFSSSKERVRSTKRQR